MTDQISTRDLFRLLVLDMGMPKEALVIAIRKAALRGLVSVAPDQAEVRADYLWRSWSDGCFPAEDYQNGDAERFGRRCEAERRRVAAAAALPAATIRQAFA